MLAKNWRMFFFSPSSCHQLTDDRLMKLRVMSGKIYLPRLRSTYHHHPFSCIGHRTCGRGWTRWRNQGWFWFLLFPRLQKRPCLVSCLETNREIVQRRRASMCSAHAVSGRINFFFKKKNTRRHAPDFAALVCAVSLRWSKQYWAHMWNGLDALGHLGSTFQFGIAVAFFPTAIASKPNMPQATPLHKSEVTETKGEKTM
jgi:hypothetical protein